MAIDALIVVAIAVMTGAALQRLSGTGVGLVLAPVLTVALGPVQGILITNVTTAVSGLMLTLSVLSRIEAGHAARIVAGALPGCIVGAVLVAYLPSAVLQVAVGAIIAIGLWVTGRGGFQSLSAGPAVQATCWFLGGVGNTSAGVAAPALIVYAQVSRWDQRAFAATMQPVFMSLGLISLSLKGIFAQDSVSVNFSWTVGLVVLVAIAAGLAGGLLLERYVQPDRARRVAIWLAWAGAGAAIVKGLAGLLL